MDLFFSQHRLNSSFSPQCILLTIQEVSAGIPFFLSFYRNVQTRLKTIAEQRYPTCYCKFKRVILLSCQPTKIEFSAFLKVCTYYNKGILFCLFEVQSSVLLCTSEASRKFRRANTLNLHHIDDIYPTWGFFHFILAISLHNFHIDDRIISYDLFI